MNQHWIFFDLDNTLWNFSYNSELSLEYMYENFPIISSIFNSKDKFIETYHIHNAKLWDMFSQGEVNSDRLRIERWQQTLFPGKEDKGIDELCEKLDTFYLRRLAQFPNLMEGAEKMLKELTRNNLIAILSNGFPDTQYAKAMNSGLWKYITRLIVSGEINKNKPHPDLFKYAIEETGAKPPYIMIGDHFETDVIGAMKAGWHAVWLNPSDEYMPCSFEEIKKKGIDPKLLLGITNNLAETREIIDTFLNQLNQRK